MPPLRGWAAVFFHRFCHTNVWPGFARWTAEAAVPTRVAAPPKIEWGYGLPGCSRIPDWVGAPDVEKFLVARSDDGNIFLAGYAVQSRAEILHLLAIQTAQRNLDRLLGAQLRKVGQNIGHRLPVFSFATQRNVGSTDGRVVSVTSLSTPVPLSSHQC